MGSIEFWAMCLCWLSTSCSAILTIVYLRLGYRFRLLTFLSASLLLQHSQKIYLMTVRVLMPHLYKPCLLASMAVLVNSFFVAAYNLSLIAICLHVYLLIQAAGTGYDHVRVQVRYIQIICTLSGTQLLHQMWHSRNCLWAIESLPYYWIQFVILCGQVLVCPTLVGHLLWKCWRARERTMDLLRRSSISSSLMWRLLISLMAVAIMTGRTILIQIGNDARFGGTGSFKGFQIWEATGPQLAARYQIGNIVGPVLMLIFLTAQEPSDYVIERLVVLRDITLCRNRKRRRASSIPWLETETSHGRGTYKDQEMACTMAAPRQSQSATGSMNPRESGRQESFDITIHGASPTRMESKRPRMAEARRNSESEVVPARPSAGSGRSASLEPVDPPLQRSDSMRSP